MRPINKEVSVIDKNTSHLAGEFLVVGELSRRGYPVSITMGNAKSVDIRAGTQKGTVEIEAKAGRSKGNWPITRSSINPNKKDRFYIFVFLGTKTQIENGKIPEYFVVKGEELLPKVEQRGTLEGVRYKSLKDENFENEWGKLPPSR